MTEAEQALQDLRDVRGFNDKEYNKRLDIIENALKTKYFFISGGRESGKTFFIKVTTALEIIRDKKVNVKELLKCNTVGKYNYRIYKEDEKLSESNFELLKEVLAL